jgi:AcrR family transcriptional regulator
LAIEATNAVGVRKGERTKLRLKSAMAQLLADTRFSDVRVSDICRLASVAPGTFYLYFENKETLAIELLSEFDQYMRGRLADVRRGSERLFESIFESTFLYVTLFQTNAGLMHCLMHMSDEIPEFARVYHRFNREWNGRVAEAFMRRMNTEALARDAVLGVVYALGAMTDQFLNYLYLQRDPNVEAIAGDSRKVAELLSILWHRGVTAADPSENFLRHPMFLRVRASPLQESRNASNKGQRKRA